MICMTTARAGVVVSCCVAMMGAMLTPAVAAEGQTDAEVDAHLLVEVAGAADDITDGAPVAASTVDDPLRPLQWHLDRIRAPDAWAITRGREDVTIAIVDTGVDPDHRDLAGALWQDPVTGASGYDHQSRSSTTYLGPVADWHGTAIAGIAAARADDGYGIAGVAPEVRLMVHRIYGSANEVDPPDGTSYSLAAEAIRAATAAGADVILLSWGGRTPSAALASAIQDAGVPVVAAAGNDGQDFSDNPTVRRYPAVYRFPNLVTVAATDRNNRILDDARFPSNYGVRHVDIGAPGTDIVSLVPNGAHDFYDGTSFAAPQVAAALAPGRSLAPGVPTNDLVATLVATARRTPTLRDRVTSGGVLDVAAFLRAVERPACFSPPPSTFPDLDRSSVHTGNIDCIAWYGITQGTASGYAANRTITRGEMATLLVRVLDAAGHPRPAAPTPRFVDVAGTTHEGSILALAELGLVSGVGGGLFDPQRAVTRAQMATFVTGAFELLAEVELATDREWFDDIEGNVHAGSIVQAREAGITLGGTDPRLFSPNRDMTRAQMASFLARLLDALGRQGLAIERLP